MLSLGTVLPQEILRMIIRSISYDTEPEDPSSRKLWRRQLGQLLLTCRDWAQVCRGKLFSLVKIHNHGDFRILHSWAPRLETFLWELELHHEESSIPWTHLLGFPSQSPFPRWRKEGINSDLWVALYVNVEKVLPSQSLHIHPFRSLCSLVPRSVPHAFLHLSSLCLMNHHFSRFSDLVHLVWEIPSLGYLHLQKVYWDTPSDPPRPPVIRRDSDFQSVGSTDCPDAHHLLWLHATLGSLIPSVDPDIHRPGILSSQELHTLSELAQQFIKANGTPRILDDTRLRPDASALGPNNWLFDRETHHRKEFFDDPEDTWMTSIVMTLNSPAWSKTSLRIYCGLPHSETLGENATPTPSVWILCVTQLTLYLDLEEIESKWQQQDLQELDEKAGLFEHLKTYTVIIFAAALSAQELKIRATAIYQDIASQMPRMRDSGRLRLRDEAGNTF